MPLHTTSTLGLEGKTALITGATRGLGRAIAQKLCASGCRVVLNYAHSADAAEQTLAELDGLKGTAESIRADVSTPDGVHEMLEAMAARHGQLDLLVHNAALFEPTSVLQPDHTAFASARAVALGPLLYGGGAIAQLMPRGGRIVAISSNGAHEVIPGYAATSIAKAALESLVRYLAVELAPKGIAVNAVSTSMLDKGEQTGNPAVMGLLASRTPGGRLTRPQDVADAVALLCTQEAAWLQGQVITVDGGLGLMA